MRCLLILKSCWLSQKQRFTNDLTNHVRRSCFAHRKKLSGVSRTLFTAYLLTGEMHQERQRPFYTVSSNCWSDNSKNIKMSFECLARHVVMHFSSVGGSQWAGIAFLHFFSKTLVNEVYPYRLPLCWPAACMTGDQNTMRCMYANNSMHPVRSHGMFSGYSASMLISLHWIVVFRDTL